MSATAEKTIETPIDKPIETTTESSTPSTTPQGEMVTGFVRCYVEAKDYAEKRGAAIKKEAERKKAHAETERQKSKMQKYIDAMGYHGKVLVFDTETSVTLDQSLTVGCYSIYGISPEDKIIGYKSGTLTRGLLDTKQETGLFYDPENKALTKKAIETIKGFCEKNGYKFMTVSEFRNNVFYPIVWSDTGLCIGHNLRFDISRIATEWGEAREAFKGGFSFKVCDCVLPAKQNQCPDHPHVRIKSLGTGKSLFDFAGTVNFSEYNKGKRGKPKSVKKYDTKFLDTMQFGRALLGAGTPGSLRKMGEIFKAETLKSDAGEHGKINEKYLEYNVNDVEATFSLYKKQRDLYMLHQRTREPWKICSEASLGKAYLDDMEFPRFMDNHGYINKLHIGFFMQTYFGGRAGVYCRNKLTECIYADFKSQYPSVNAIMNLQSVLLAEKIELVNNVDDVREFINTVTLDDLQNPETWQKMRGIAEIMPKNDIVPLRTTYNGKTTNIGLNNVTSIIPTWYTIIDLVNSKLLTGKTPEIIQALSIVPSGRVKTNPIKLFGRDDYIIDLNKDDFFTKVIDLRTEVKADRGKHQKGTQEYEFLDSLQNGLKLLANSAGYGILVEIQPSEHLTPVRGTAYINFKRSIKSSKLEKPGKYFCPLTGTLITAGGRLLLGIAEKMANDRGLLVLMTDTDSMIFGRSDGMSREVFRSHVSDICEWFLPLSPYKSGGAFFELEDCNFYEGTKELQALYFVGVSSKRYALCNIEHYPDVKKIGKQDIRTLEEMQNRITIRAYKEHGVSGDSPPEYQSKLFDKCEPEFKDKRSAWLRDAWFIHIYKLRFGVMPPSLACIDRVNDLTILHPRREQYTLSTWHLFKIYGKPHAKDAARDIRPFNFFCLYPRVRYDHDFPASNDPKAEKYPTLYAPIGTPLQTGDGHIELFRTDTHESIKVNAADMWQITDQLPKYFEHPEAKSYPSDGIGMLSRRNLFVRDQVYIGKEYNETLEASGNFKPSEHGLDYELAEFGRHEIDNVFKDISMYDYGLYSRITGIPSNEIALMGDRCFRVPEKLLNRIEACKKSGRVEVELEKGRKRRNKPEKNDDSVCVDKVVIPRVKRATECVGEATRKALEDRTIETLAQQVGVSETTIKKAKNDLPVSPDIAARIREASMIPPITTVKPELEEALKIFRLEQIAVKAEVHRRTLYNILADKTVSDSVCNKVLVGIMRLRHLPMYH